MFRVACTTCGTRLDNIVLVKPWTGPMKFRAEMARNGTLIKKYEFTAKTTNLRQILRFPAILLNA